MLRLGDINELLAGGHILKMNYIQGDHLESPPATCAYGLVRLRGCKQVYRKFLSGFAKKKRNGW